MSNIVQMLIGGATAIILFLSMLLKSYKKKLDDQKEITESLKKETEILDKRVKVTEEVSDVVEKYQEERMELAKEEFEVVNEVAISSEPKEVLNKMIKNWNER